MPRTIELAISPELADALVPRLQNLDGVLGLARYAGASLTPPGDILTMQTCNDAEISVFKVLEEFRVHEQGTILTRQPLALLPSENSQKVEDEGNEAVWEEMAFHLRGDTNVDFNYCSLMAISGAVAAVGLWADMLHIVIGAMVIAPAFEPLVRLPFGMIVGPQRMLLRGTWSIAAGYLLMALGSLVAVLILRLIDPQASLDLESRYWVGYWSSFTPPGVLASVFAAIGGGIVISGLRSVMTTGVMIALALVPSISIVGMGLGAGDFSVIDGGLARWAVDAGLVMLISAMVIAAKRKWHHHRVCM